MTYPSIPPVFDPAEREHLERMDREWRGPARVAISARWSVQRNHRLTLLHDELARAVLRGNHQRARELAVLWAVSP